MDKTTDMTQGPIARQLILFSLPLLGSSLIQQLYNTVNLIFVGHLLGKEASAAVGASGLLVTCLVGFFTGMSIGSGVTAARCYGAKDYKNLTHTIHTAMAISLGGGFVLMILGLIASPMFLRWMNTPDDILQQATGYIRVYFLSVIPLITYNIGSGILRALGDSKSPMLYQLIGGIVNISANALCIIVLDWGVNGSAVASLCSQSIAAFLILRHLRRVDSRYRLRWRKIKLYSESAGKILKVGIPSGIQSTAITFSNIFIQYHINSLGVDVIAAFTAYFKVELFVYLPIMAFGQAATAFTGQNIGAGYVERVKKSAKAGIVVGICFTIILSSFLLIFARQAFGLFTTDVSVIDIGVSLAHITFPLQFIYVFLEVFASTIRGAGKATAPMVIVLINMCGMRIILLQIFISLWPSAQGVALTYPVTWLITALCMAVYYRFGRWVSRIKTVTK